MAWLRREGIGKIVAHIHPEHEASATIAQAVGLAPTPQLIYSVIASLDGYIADEDGSLNWAVPDEEVLDHVTGQLRTVSTYLYGRRMYELMAVWENDPAAPEQSPGSAESASVWVRARKVLFSTTLAATSTSNTTLERAFDPERVARVKAESKGDLTIDGTTVAAHAFRAGLVDILDVIVVPVMIGGGGRASAPTVSGSTCDWMRSDASPVAWSACAGAGESQSGAELHAAGTGVMQVGPPSSP